MIVQVIMYPLAWPIGKVLDRVLGEEGQSHTITRSRLTECLQAAIFWLAARS